MTYKPKNPPPYIASDPAFDPKKYTNSRITEEQVLMAKESFDYLCEDNGRLTVRQFKMAMIQMGYKFFSSVFVDLDTDKPMTIDFKEWLEVMIPNVRSRAYLERIFWIFDRQSAGFVSWKDLKKMAKELGEEISEEQMKEMVKMGKQAEGYISSQEFYSIMTKNLKE